MQATVTRSVVSAVRRHWSGIFAKKERRGAFFCVWVIRILSLSKCLIITAVCVKQISFAYLILNRIVSKSCAKFFLSEEIWTRMELLKLLTLPSQICSINSSGLITWSGWRRKYSNRLLSFRVRESGIWSIWASLVFVSNDMRPQVRQIFSWINLRRVRLRILASSSSKWKGFVR